MNQTWMRIAWSAPVVAVLALAAVDAARARHPGGLPYYSDDTFTPQWIEPSSPQLAAVPRVGAFAFTDQRGERVTEAAIAGRVAIVNFFHTRCGACLVVLERLRAVATRHATDGRVVLLSHSVLPRADSIPQLARFAASQRIDAPAWHLLTGPDTAVRRVALESYHLPRATVASWAADSAVRTNRVLLVDGQGRVRGVYNGTLEFEMDNLETDLQVLLGQGGGR